MELARGRSGVIVSADSMQVYRGMDIGTAKASAQDQAEVPHEMVDVANPSADYTVAHFQQAARACLTKHGDRFVVLAGGSGLHVRAVVDPMEFPPYDATIRAEVEGLGEGRALSELRQADPSVSDVLDVKNPRRVNRALEIIRAGGPTPTQRSEQPEYRQLREYVPLLPFLGFGFDPGDALEGRVRSRVAMMMDAGLVDEVAGLADDMGQSARQAVGYKELVAHLEGATDLETAQENIVAATLRLVKRQRTYFRRDPRITWLPWNDDAQQRATTLDAAIDSLSP